MEKILINTTHIPVRFSEVDSLRVVWHGHYVTYFEDGRENFGSEFGLTYLDIKNNGFVTPIVKLNLDYKRPLTYGETAIIETSFINSPAAKLIFQYKIYRSSDQLLAATGESTQVFLNHEGELNLIVPDFIAVWKRKWELS